MVKTAICGWPACVSSHHITTPTEGQSGYTAKKPQVVVKTLLVMKLTALFLTVGILNVCAKSVSQNVTFSGEKVTLLSVLNAVEKQTGFLFLYPESEIRSSKPVTIKAENIPLEQFLVQLFKSQPLDYSIKGKSIFLSPKPDAGSPGRQSSNDIAALLNDLLIEVRGKVVNDAGEPLVGANIVVKGTRKGTTTNSNGEFILGNVEEGSTLVISSIGYEETTVKASRSFANVSLKRSESKMEEVVVSTGYTTRKPGEITGSVQKISGEELRRGVTSADPAALLKGRTTGLYISEQGAGDPTSVSQIFVRGQSSIAGVGVDQLNEFVVPQLNYGPLLVLDGVIMPNQNLRDLVTPQEIEDIVILKDASATAIYGSRAAGGVLVVTTKKGRAETPRIGFDLKYGINKPNQGTIRFLNARELYDVQTQYFTEQYNRSGPMSQIRTTYPTVQDYLTNRMPALADIANSYNWSDLIFRTTNTKDANVSVSGGNERTRYYVGIGYYDEQSTGIQNALTRKSFRLNLDNRLSNKLRLSLSLNGILNNGLRDADGAVTTIYQVIPWANPYDANGVLKYALEYKLNGNPNVRAKNPLYDAQYNYSEINSKLFFGSVRLEYKINDWLSFSSTNSGNLNFNKNERYIDARTFEGSGNWYSPQGFLGTGTNNLSSYLTSNQLSFSKTFERHSLRALAAIEYGQTKVEDITVNVRNVRAGYPVITMGREIGGSASYFPSTKVNNVEGGEDVRAVYSVFGEAGYTYNDKYTLSASLRTDASSSFGRDQRYGTFYSGGAAWVVSREGFMQNIKAINNLKLRASYGTSGSQLGDNFLTRTLYDPRYQYAGAGGSGIAILGNTDLKWEVTKTLSGGLELGMFKVIDLTVDLYSRRSEDLLQQTSLRSLAGFPTQWRNVASVQNKGIEIMINSRNITKGDFRWSTSFNLTYNKNTILKVNNDSLAQGFGGEFYLYPGEDINTIKAVKYAGVDPQTGKPLFEKLLFDDKGNVTGVTYVNTVAAVNHRVDTRQNQVIGSFQPRYFGGFINNFSYKSFSLSVMITYALDYVMRDALAGNFQGRNITAYNQVAYRPHQVMWTTPGQTNATEPAFYEHATTSYYGSSKYIHDASHAALRNVRLSYDLPKTLLGKMKMSNASVYVSADNLYTRYSKHIIASNPEGPSVGEAQSFGGASGAIGIPRRYLLGLQITF